MKKNMEKGFTLIELLIVIAIIGILAGVILVSTSSARTKAKISAFKAEASGIVPGAIMACDGGSAATLLNLPTFKNLTVISGGTNCTGDGTFSIVVKSNDTNTGTCNTNVTTQVVTQNGVTFDAAC